jgi:hypothetical protein
LNTCTSEQAVSLDGGQEEATRQKKPKAPKAKAANADAEKAPVKDEPRNRHDNANSTAQFPLLRHQVRPLATRLFAPRKAPLPTHNLLN